MYAIILLDFMRFKILKAIYLILVNLFSNVIKKYEFPTYYMYDVDFIILILILNE